MTFSDFPDPDRYTAAENFRAVFHQIVEQRFADHPELERHADDRAQTMCRSFVEFTEAGEDHPAFPTLKSGVRKLLFALTDPEDFAVAPTDEDMAVLLMEFYEAGEENLQITANLVDTYANYITVYTLEVQEAIGAQWGQMDGSQRMGFVRQYAHERAEEDFE